MIESEECKSKVRRKFSIRLGRHFVVGLQKFIKT